MTNEMFLEAVFRFNTNGLLVIDHQYNVINLNEAACKMLNIEPETAIGQPLSHTLEPLFYYMHQTITEGLEFDFAPYVYLYGGRPRLIRLQTRQLLDRDQSLIGAVAILSEPTDILKMASVVCDSMPIACFVFDYKEQLTHMNQAAIKLLGYELPEFLGLTSEEIIKIIIHPDIKAKPIVRYVLESGKPSRQVRDRVLTKDGRQIAIVADCFPLIDTFGTTIGALNILRRVEEEFVYFQGTGKFLLDILPEAVIAVDNQRVAVVYNRAAEELFQVPRVNAINLSVEKIMSRLPADKLAIIYELMRGEEYINRPIQLNFGEKKREFLLDIRKVLDEEGNSLGAIAVLRDVTELREMDMAIQKSARLSMIGELAAGMAHEIRNPLTTIRGFIQLLRDRYLSQNLPEIREYSDIVLSEIDRVNSLIHQFLMLGQSRPQKRIWFNLEKLLDDLCPLFENETLMREICLKRFSRRTIPALEGDPDQLKQVFTNLFNNAIQAMEKGGELIIETDYDPGNQQAIIRFTDTGHGMSEEVLSKIFHPFFTTREDGTGLGLSISHQIVDAHGGKILVDSKPGKGTTVSVLLPTANPGYIYM